MIWETEWNRDHFQRHSLETSVFLTWCMQCIPEYNLMYPTWNYKQEHLKLQSEVWPVGWIHRLNPFQLRPQNAVTWDFPSAGQVWYWYLPNLEMYRLLFLSVVSIYFLLMAVHLPWQKSRCQQGDFPYWESALQLILNVGTISSLLFAVWPLCLLPATTHTHIKSVSSPLTSLFSG